MADRIGKGYVVEFQLFDREPMQRRDAEADAELEALAREVESAKRAVEALQPSTTSTN